MNLRIRVTRLLVAFAVLSCSLWMAGCKQSPTAEQIRLELEQQLPGVRFERQSHVRLGWLSMRAVKQVLRFTMPSDSTDRKLFASLKRVDVATYRVLSPPNQPTIDGVAVLRSHLERAGWSVAIKEKDDDERNWVIYRADEDGAIRSLCVVLLDSFELEIASVDGHLDELFAQAIADDPNGFVESLAP
jgi:hypothetical protein